MVRNESSGVWRYLSGRWLYIRNLLITNLVFIPVLFLIGAVVLSLVSISLDRGEMGQWILAQPWFPDLGIESARAFLATVATSVVTVASLVFSLTFIALTIASQQLGPRLISRAMTDRVNQFALGVFVGTFLYALLVLGATDRNSTGVSVPPLSIFLVFAAVSASLVLLVVFVHHTAIAIQADYVLAWQSRTLENAIDQIFPEDMTPPSFDRPDPLPADSEPITASGAGYIQVVDWRTLMSVAERTGTIIVLECRPGHFVSAGIPLCHVISGTRLSEDDRITVRDALVVGPVRTPAEDFEYHLRAIIDVGMRGLSAGINDYHTAMSALDWIGAAISRIMGRSMPPSALCGRAGDPKVFLFPVTFERVLHVGFRQIMDVAHDKTPIIVHLLVVLTSLARLARTAAHRDAIRSLAREVEAMAYGAGPEYPGKEEMTRRCRALQDALAA